MLLTPGLSRNLPVAAKLVSHPRAGVRNGTSTVQNVMVAPLSSYEPMLNERPVIENPAHGRQTYAFTTVVIETGMYLEVAGVEYPIRGVAPYPNIVQGGATFYHLVLEDIKK